MNTRNLYSYLPTHQEMVDAFDLPTLTQDRHLEMFGGYHYDDVTCYWEHNPRTRQWRVIGSASWRQVQLCDPRWDEQDRMVAAKLMADLDFMDPPVMPAETDVAARSEEFVFEGWRFAHYYFPELGTVRISVCGRA